MQKGLDARVAPSAQQSSQAAPQVARADPAARLHPSQGTELTPQPLHSTSTDPAGTENASVRQGPAQASTSQHPQQAAQAANRPQAEAPAEPPARPSQQKADGGLSTPTATQRLPDQPARLGNDVQDMDQQGRNGRSGSLEASNAASLGRSGDGHQAAAPQPTGLEHSGDHQGSGLPGRPFESHAPPPGCRVKHAELCLALVTACMDGYTWTPHHSGRVPGMLCTASKNLGVLSCRRPCRVPGLLDDQQQQGELTNTRHRNQPLWQLSLS